MTEQEQELARLDELREKALLLSIADTVVPPSKSVQTPFDRMTPEQQALYTCGESVFIPLPSPSVRPDPRDTAAANLAKANEGKYGK